MKKENVFIQLSSVTVEAFLILSTMCLRFIVDFKGGKMNKSALKGFSVIGEIDR